MLFAFPSSTNSTSDSSVGIREAIVEDILEIYDVGCHVWFWEVKETSKSG